MNVCMGQEERQQVIYLAKPKQNDPKQTYTHIPAPACSCRSSIRITRINDTK